MEHLKFSIQNFMRISAVEIDADGDLTILTGDNDQGKSACIKAIRALFGGKKFIPDNPIKDGENEAVITGEVNNMIATVKIKRKEDGGYQSTWKLQSKDGAIYNSPIERLAAFIGKELLDPEEFLHMESKKQLETLLKIVDIKVDTERLKAISGLPEVKEDENPIVTINNVYNQLYDSRRMVNRDLERTRKTLESMGKVEKAEPVSVVELVAEKERLEAENEEIDSKWADVIEQRNLVNDIGNNINRIEEQIRILQAQLEEEKENLQAQEEQLAKMEEEACILEKHDLTDINARIASADETNRKAQKYADWLKQKEELEKYQAESQSYTERLDAIKAYKEELIANAKFPVPGLGFDENGVTYKGQPLKTCVSASDQFIVSFAIAANQNPRPSIILMENAEKCGKAKRDLIRKLSAHYGIKTIIEVFSESRDAEGIVIEDGRVAKVNKAVS